MSKKELLHIGRELHQLENKILDTDEIDLDRLQIVKIVSGLSDRVSNLAESSVDVDDVKEVA